MKNAAKKEGLSDAQIRIVIESLKEKKDYKEKKLVETMEELNKLSNDLKNNKRLKTEYYLIIEDFKEKKKRIIRDIVEIKEVIEEVKKTRSYRICGACKKDIDLEYLTEHPLTKNCEECEKKERAAALKR